MTKLLEKVMAQANQLPDAQQDEVAIALLNSLEQFTPKEVGGSKPYRRAGSAEGLIGMSDDFDEPLEDFKEYI